MRIEVTVNHIRRGVRHDGKWCPIALALREKFPGVSVVAYPNYIGISTEDFYPPPEATAFMMAFDRGVGVQPFAFDLDGLEGP